MSPWISISVSVVTAVLMALVGFIAKRELGRVASDIAELKKGLDKISADLAARLESCDTKFLSKEVFHGLEQARKDLDKLRHEQDGRLEALITKLLAKHGG